MAHRIRQAQPDDAEALLMFMRRLLREPDLPIGMDALDFRNGVADERRWIAAHNAVNAHLLVAETVADTEPPTVIGVCGCHGPRTQRARHCTELGVSVDQAWRGQGVGTALLTELIAWAEANPLLHRLELRVYAVNADAIRLYERLGFHHEGRRRDAVWFRGAYEDELLMAMLFD